MGEGRHQGIVFPAPTVVRRASTYTGLSGWCQRTTSPTVTDGSSPGVVVGVEDTVFRAWGSVLPRSHRSWVLDRLLHRHVGQRVPEPFGGLYDPRGTRGSSFGCTGTGIRHLSHGGLRPSMGRPEAAHDLPWTLYSGKESFQQSPRPRVICRVSFRPRGAPPDPGRLFVEVIGRSLVPELLNHSRVWGRTYRDPPVTPHGPTVPTSPELRPSRRVLVG